MGIIEGVFFMCVGHWTRTSLPPGLDCFSYRLAGAEPGITHSMAGLPETDCFMVKPKWLGTQWGQTIADMGEMSNLNTTLYQKGLSGFVTSFLNASLSKEQLWGFIEGKKCTWQKFCTFDQLQCWYYLDLERNSSTVYATNLFPAVSEMEKSSLAQISKLWSTYTFNLNADSVVEKSSF